ncbi:MAG: FeoA family protein [Rickettsiales bacterium]
MKLADLKRGHQGRITAIDAGDALLRKLLELGLHEGMDVRLAHTGPFGSDPIAIEISDRCIALRRRDASHITIEPIG